MALPGNVYRELLDIINKQLSLYEEYLKIQNDEREGLKKANVQKIKENTVLRSNILEYIYAYKLDLKRSLLSSFFWTLNYWWIR